MGHPRLHESELALYLFDTIGHVTDTLWHGEGRLEDPIFYMKRAGYILWGPRKGSLAPEYQLVHLDDKRTEDLPGAPHYQTTLVPSPTSKLFLKRITVDEGGGITSFKFSFISPPDTQGIGNRLEVKGNDCSPTMRWSSDSTVEIGFDGRVRVPGMPHTFFTFGPFHEVVASETTPACNYPETSSGQYKPGRGLINYDPGLHKIVFGEGPVRRSVKRELDANPLTLCKD